MSKIYAPEIELAEQRFGRESAGKGELGSDLNRAL